MSNTISKVSLEDSLYVLQLARETALAQNRQAQARRMSPVVEEMQGLIANPPQGTNAATPSTGVMGQGDFQTLLNISQARLHQAPAAASTTQSVLERNRLISAMADANMSDVDIARQFSMSREEVQLVFSFQKNRS